MLLQRALRGNCDQWITVQWSFPTRLNFKLSEKCQVSSYIHIIIYTFWEIFKIIELIYKLQLFLILIQFLRIFSLIYSIGKYRRYRELIRMEVWKIFWTIRSEKNVAPLKSKINDWYYSLCFISKNTVKTRGVGKLLFSILTVHEQQWT